METTHEDWLKGLEGNMVAALMLLSVPFFAVFFVVVVVMRNRTAIEVAADVELPNADFAAATAR